MERESWAGSAFSATGEVASELSTARDSLDRWSAACGIPVKLDRHRRRHCARAIRPDADLNRSTFQALFHCSAQLGAVEKDSGPAGRGVVLPTIGSVITIVFSPSKLIVFGQEIMDLRPQIMISSAKKIISGTEIVISRSNYIASLRDLIVFKAKIIIFKPEMIATKKEIIISTTTKTASVSDLTATMANKTATVT